MVQRVPNIPLPVSLLLTSLSGCSTFIVTNKSRIKNVHNLLRFHCFLPSVFSLLQDPIWPYLLRLLLTVTVSQTLFIFGDFWYFLQSIGQICIDCPSVGVYLTFFLIVRLGFLEGRIHRKLHVISRPRAHLSHCWWCSSQSPGSGHIGQISPQQSSSVFLVFTLYSLERSHCMQPTLKKKGIMFLPLEGGVST